MYRRRRILTLFEDKPEDVSHRPKNRTQNSASRIQDGRVSPSDHCKRHRLHFRYCLMLMLIQVAAFLLLSSRNDGAVSRKLRVINDSTATDPDKPHVHTYRNSESMTTSPRLNGFEDAHERQKSLDNYYSRHHMDEFREQHDKPILIVGGSDGSGTRAVVDLLGRLGVPMLVDDTGTYDVDASCLSHGKGWPPLVQKVMEATHSAKYSLEDLPTHVLNQAMEEFETFHSIYQDRADRLLLEIRQSNRTVVSKVNYGFKAPVSMLMLPILREVYGRIKFLHVIRDGRDVSVSDNQSPVQKFYDSFYEDSWMHRQLYDKPDDVELRSLLAMDLWNDWNVQVHDWAMHHNDGTTFDYLVVRSEDLLDPLLRQKTLVQLSHFVGSPRKPGDICCISNLQMTDMGQSDGKTRRRGTDARAIIPFADVETLSDHGSSTGLFYSNLEALHLSWKDSIASITSSDVGLEIKKSHEPKGDEEGENSIPLALKLAHEILSQRLSAKDNARQTGSSTKSIWDTGTKRVASVDESSTMQNGLSEVKKRYGKWVERLKDRPDVVALMQAKGAAALELFGYQPRRRFLDDSSPGAMLCDEFVVCDA